MKDSIVIDKFIKKNYINIICIIIIFLCTFPNFIVKISSGLDPSWVQALNFFVGSKYKFGEDIIFTYGPLGFLNSACSFKNVIIGCIFWIILHFFNMYLIYDTLKYKNNIQKILFTLFITFACPFSGEYYLNFLGIILIAKMWYEDKRKYIYVYDGLLGIVFLYKFSNFTLLFIEFIFYIVCDIIKIKKIYKDNIIGLLLGIVVIPVSYIIYNPSLRGLINYIKGGYEITSGFNIGMSYFYKDAYIIWAFLVFILYIMLLIFSYKNNNKKDWLFLLILLPTLFIAYKHGFVRADDHIYISIFCLLWISAIIVIFTFNENNSLYKYTLISIGLISMILSTHNFSSIISIMKNNIFDLPQKVVESKYMNGSKYIEKIEDEILYKIGNGTVTIYPYEISYILANELNYRPMPIIQIYSAYTPYLDKLNAEFFNIDEKAPKYIIFSSETIDKRLPFIEAPETYKAIYENYTIVNYTDNFLLLERLENKKILNKQLIHNEIKDKSDQIIIDNYDIININMELNILGKLAKILWKVPEVNLNVEYKNDENRSGRIIPENLSGDVLINSLPYDNMTFANYIDGDGNLSLEIILLFRYKNKI